jgi:ABC-2 type transport system permease protein
VASTSAALARPPVTARALRPAAAVAERAWRDARTRTLSFACLFGLYAYIQPIAYRRGFPTHAERATFARSFAENKAVRLFYGVPHNLLTVNGYAAWRVGGTLAIFAAVYGLLAAVRALRSEEDTGRMELVLAGVVGRRSAYLSTMAAIAAGVAVLWLAETLGFIAAGLPAGGSAYLALATVSVIPPCVGIGALASQLAPTRRLALELAGAIIGVLFVARVIADTASGVGWLRWVTPLGWAEELRPFANPAPLVLALSITATTLLLTLSARIATGRDIGTGLLTAHDSAPARLRLLSSPTAQALRSERTSLTIWLLSSGLMGYILGVLAKSSSAAGISKNLDRELAKLGSGSIVTPAGYLGFTFIFFVLVVSLFCCAQIAAARREEAGQQLETLLALPVARRRWLAGRLLLAALAASAISLTAGVMTWVGVESGGASVPLSKLIEAGANCLPVALLFGGIAAVAYALAPRASAGVAYALVTLAFLWDLVGSLLSVPSWLVKLTPFAHIGLVPAQPFRVTDAAVMLALAGLSALAAVTIFARRDLTGQ